LCLVVRPRPCLWSWPDWHRLRETLHPHLRPLLPLLQRLRQLLRPLPHLRLSLPSHLLPSRISHRE
jgi:hypothetical protein